MMPASASVTTSEREDLLNDRVAKPVKNPVENKVFENRTSSHSVHSNSSYWETCLADVAALELPTDYPRPATLGSTMGVESCSLSEEFSEALGRISEEAGVDVATVGLAIFLILLHRYSAFEKFIVATGDAAALIPVAADFSDRPSLLHLLRRLQTSIRHSAEAGDILADLLERFAAERDTSRHPIYQVAFFPSPLKTPFASPFRSSETAAAGLDLYLEFEGHRQPTLRLHFNEDLFARASVARMLSHMRELLTGAVHNLDRPCAELPMLTADELRQQLVEWNDTARSFPTICLHQLVELVAEKRPDGIAVVHAEQSLTYGELNARANQVAHYLQKHGVDRNARVGICLRRSLDFAVSLLGVLKAGGTCVPLDPSYPSERLTVMLEDVAAAVVLTEPGLLKATVPAGTNVVHFSQERPTIAAESSSNPSVGSVPGDIAYVIYTSGSTGRPRGVLLSHAGLANYTQAAVGLFDLLPGDRMLQFCSISFDAAVEEIFSTWAAGATLVFRRDDVSLEPSELLGWAAQQGITVMDLPTAYWHEWVYALPSLSQKVPPALRLVIVGGEKSSSEAYSTWNKFVGNRVRWINTYGPAEASVVTTAYEPKLKSGETLPTVLPIGRPVANARVYLLDAQLNPVPVGAPGELHIGGAGVARGYLNLPRMTEEKFIRDVFSKDEDPSARLYKTGDLARYLPSGEIEFLGRRDNQVKIRGFRVEPGEIESALIQHPGVHEAAIVLHEDAADSKRLVGYVVRTQQGTATESDLRKHLQMRLPEYMVPSEFVFLQAMPLTPNGKINRRALPTATLAKSDTGFDSAAAATAIDPVQMQLMEIWQELLGRKAIHVTDDFFDLGGHSLLAARLMHRVKQVFDKTLPLAVLLEAPTIQQLAIVLREGSSNRWSSLVALQPEGSNPPFFCVHGVGGNVVGFHELARHMKPDYPFYGLQSYGLDGKHSLHTRIEDMAAHYLTEIRAVQPEGPYQLGGFSLGGLVAYEMASQLQSRGQEVSLLVLFDTYASNPKPVNQSLLHLLLHPTWAQLQQLPSVLRKKIRRTRLARRLPELLKTVMSTNARAAEQYQLRPYAGKATLLRAGDTWRGGDDPYAKWGQLLGTLGTVKIPGAHMDMLRDPHVGLLAEHLKSCIEGAACSEKEVFAGIE
jgi:amino acid adenylation domain-containing protein